MRTGRHPPQPVAAAADDDLPRRYHRLYDNAPEGIFRTTPAGRVLAANPAMVRLLGHATEAAVLAYYTDLGRQLYVDPARRGELVRRLRDGEAVEQFEAEVVRADGRRAWFSFSAWTERDAAGTVVEMEATVRDVTRQKRAESDLLRNAAEARKLALVVSRTHNPVLVTDAAGRVEWANAAFTALTGYSTAEVAGCLPHELLAGPRTDPATLATLRERTAAGEPFAAEVLHYTRAGRPFWLAIDVEPVRDDAGVVRQFVANLSDVTDRKRGQWLDLDRRKLLERVARHEPVDATLAAVCQAVARQWDGARAAVLRYEPATAATAARRWTAAADRVCPDFTAAVDCGLVGLTACPFAPADATAFAESFVPDVATAESWADLRAAAAADGIVACRSVPVLGGDGSLLGELLVLLGPESVAAAADDGFRRAVASFAGLAALAVEHQRLTDRLACQATHDPLTGLPNRARLDASLPGWLAAAARAGRPVGVLMVDLDGFKHVNDTLGHAAGDALLVQVGRRLSAAARDGDVLVRMGGDEFTLIATDLAAAPDVAGVAARLIAALAAPFSVDGRELFVTASIGTAAFPVDGSDAGSLVRNADAALYAAKGAGRNRSASFDPAMNAAARDRLDIEGRLRRIAAALNRGEPSCELRLAYQPQVDGAGRLRGMEALLQWHDPVAGRVSPAKFIPVAEASGLIVPIGAWVLRDACRQAAAWRDAGLRPVPVGVNVSGLQFGQADFVAVVTAALADHDLDARWLELELTESVVMGNTADAAEKLSAVRHLGVTVAIDDFGTGYSSLAYLRRLPIDRLKVDQSFVRDLTDGSAKADVACITAIVGLAVSLGLSTVAEGVETVAQRDHLLRLGCDTLQGYLYSQPVAPDRMADLLRRGRIDLPTVALAAAA